MFQTLKNRLRIQTDYIDRELYYSTSKDEWESQMPNNNWCLILISNLDNEVLIDEIISKSITNNVGYICGIGQNHVYIHNQADNEYVERDIGESEFPKSKYHIMTVGDEDLDEGIWFGLNLSFNGEVDIDKIHIIDTDCKWEDEIVKLISRFKEGYLPNED
ncbi:MAG: hypothetical protein IPL46_22055 [Saprospiraceae bacterium]|nr:hypothetical protein [Saprospiraceae bacterium]